jgi:hypothetical protein
MPRPEQVPQKAAVAREPANSPRAAWSPPRIVVHGSMRHLVRGISGFLTDTFGMPGMRKA